MSVKPSDLWGRGRNKGRNIFGGSRNIPGAGCRVSSIGGNRLQGRDAEEAKVAEVLPARGEGKKMGARRWETADFANPDKRNRDAAEQAMGGDGAVWRRLKPG